MEKIRRHTFETNSSSTHTITISKYQKPREENIPRNLTRTTGKVFDIVEYGDCGGDDETYACDTMRTEVEKLSFIINMVASVASDLYYNSEDYDDLWDSNKVEDNEYITQCFNKFVSMDLFIWLKEAVLEETGTMINYVQPESNWFPFYETTYDENDGVEEILCANDKEKFKNRVKEIIFDGDIVIENEVCPYGMER